MGETRDVPPGRGPGRDAGGTPSPASAPGRRPFALAWALAGLWLVAPPAPAADRPGGPPNILILLADDMGFSDAGCYGGEIPTPNLDRLAAGGLRYTRFYNTGRCWPTRACILTGHYAQQVRMDPPSGPLPGWARVLPQRLKPVGYRCYHSGKWHLNGAPRPVADGGFDRSYSLEDHDRYFSPQRHTEDDRPLPPASRGEGYYATAAIADHAIRCLREHGAAHPGRPFLSYVAFIAPHFPLHAMAEDFERHRGRYDAGWDALRSERWARARRLGIVSCALAEREPAFTPRYLREGVLGELGPGEVIHPVAWEDLDAERRRFQATKMALHAAMVDRMDREIGRILAQVEAMGARERTLVFFLSDNGADATVLVRGDRHDPAAAPGSASSYLCLGPGWASACNAPLRRYKVWMYEGGIATPLIACWPDGIRARGELRSQVGHVIDLVPTLLELAGIDPLAAPGGEGAPPLPGRSLVPSFATDGAVARDFLFFHHEGNRALLRGDWKIVSSREGGDAWELYHLADDRCEAVDLAGREPARLRGMIDLWERCEAEVRAQAGMAPARVRANP